MFPRRAHDPSQDPHAVLDDALCRPPRPAVGAAPSPGRQRRDLESVEAAERAGVVTAAEAEVVDAAGVCGVGWGVF